MDGHLKLTGPNSKNVKTIISKNDDELKSKSPSAGVKKFKSYHSPNSAKNPNYELEDVMKAQKLQKKLHEKAISHKIKKSLLHAELMKLYPPPKPSTALSTAFSSMTNPEDEHAHRLVRAASLVTNFSLTSVYDIGSEYGRKLEISLLHSLTRLQRTTKISVNRLDVNHLIDTSMMQLEHSLLGCDINVGMLQPGGNYIKFDFTSKNSTVKDLLMHRLASEANEP